jgi:hypothetical protein
MDSAFSHNVSLFGSIEVFIVCEQLLVSMENVAIDSTRFDLLRRTCTI